jgi:predicted membrane channel-forming protein YqfA (hemolysin III family)
MEMPLITYSQQEERANTISHVAGALMAFVAGFYLISQSSGLTEWGRVGVWS